MSMSPELKARLKARLTARRQQDRAREVKLKDLSAVELDIACDHAHELGLGLTPTQELVDVRHLRYATPEQIAVFARRLACEVGYQSLPGPSAPSWHDVGVLAVLTELHPDRVEQALRTLGFAHAADVRGLRLLPLFDGRALVCVMKTLGMKGKNINRYVGNRNSCWRFLVHQG